MYRISYDTSSMLFRYFNLTCFYSRIIRAVVFGGARDELGCWMSSSRPVDRLFSSAYRPQCCFNGTISDGRLFVRSCVPTSLSV